jgi:hypothetical protein
MVINTVQGVAIEPGTGFTVIGVAAADPVFTFAQVRLDDGRVGFLLPFEWNTEDPKVTAARFSAKLQREQDKSEAEFAARRAEDDARQARWREKCAAGKPEIGMTRAEVIKVWCQPWAVNATETALGTREQWVYRHPDRGYLYFEDGRRVAIQRRN